ncbi:aminopeptidase [Pulveribacter sp.]|uniref:aminopeptidase n=1 Tax=Pulveribacter sp. TaxID=2678893 RepID=UPI0028A686EB|nr:aminopeptidase [Pulveribacter sp.]
MLLACCRILAQTLLLAGACTLLAGCAHGGGTLGYYWQSLRGHLALLHAARPVPEWLAEPDTPAPLRQRLELALQAREFASRVLALPDNASYRRYARLDRSAAVWNVVAAPPWSLTLHTWCFPVTGCIGYRGYFVQADAEAEGRRLEQQGLEVSVYPVPAYSTLGYSNWLGGDPLLSTFIGWPEGDFVRLLFHELAHQQAYASGDTRFNESYATAVERLGVEQWLQARGDAAVRQQYERSEERRRQWRALTQQTRARLTAIYESKQALAQDWKALAAMKSKAMQTFAEDYARLRADWVERQGVAPQQLALLDRWVQGANNASFAAQGAYDDLVPAFMALFAREGRDWPRFHAAVRALAAAPQGERETKIRELNQP